MKNVDVITKYLDACKSGLTDEQAELFARSWAESMELHPQAATKSDVKNAIKELRSEISGNFKIVYVLGSAIFMVSCLPLLEKIFSK